jgi:methionine-S-sulfoxide reductase
MKETVAFGGGCFWCTEAVFKMLKGVASVEPGYAGGTTDNPTYSKLHAGMNDHAEVVRIEYDPENVTFKTLLTIFFASHDATQVDGQGNDKGPEYRSLVLYTTEKQKSEAEAFIDELDTSSREGDPITTEVAPLTKFYSAEAEHVDFYAKNQNAGYCQIIIAPKLQKVQKEYAELLKTI